MKMIFVLLLLAILVATCRAITQPDCTVRQDLVCSGHREDEYANGTAIDEILNSLYVQFCGCRNISGSIHIDMASLEPIPIEDVNSGLSSVPQPDASLSEDDFNSLYYVEQVYGNVVFKNIPQIKRIHLPSLRLIRGRNLISERYALFLENLDTSEIVFPNLVEITQGSVKVNQANNQSICNIEAIEWEDILNDGTFESNACINQEDIPTCSDECGIGSSRLRSCWTSEASFCHMLSKIPSGCTSCGINRCFYDSTALRYKCCDSDCSAGCVGPTAQDCRACRYFDNRGTCVSQCPPKQLYDPASSEYVSNPFFKFAEDGFCVANCSADRYLLDTDCVEDCPKNHMINETSGECIPCDGPCPKVCDGLSIDEFLELEHIENFRGCTIITGAINIGALNSTNLMSELEMLSTIHEIRGVLRIEKYPETTFPFLRNLRKVGSNITKDLYPSMCDNDTVLSALIIRDNTMMTAIDLRHLETVVGGVTLVDNPELCFIGDLLSYTTHQSCVIRPRRDASSCISDDLVCHKECHSNSSCWGARSHHCEYCRNFLAGDECVSACDNQTQNALYNESVCQDCHPECSGGCFGEEPSECHACKNFKFLQTCVESCPLGTYVTGNECQPCFENCTRGLGCAGPKPFVDHQSGCLDCSLVQLTRSGSQDKCLADTCSPGYYQDTYTAQANSSNNLTVGTAVCRPCHRECAECVGPGKGEACLRCVYATRNSECVPSCDDHTEYFDPGTQSCVRCDPSCTGGCNGSQCFDCARGYFRQYAEDNPIDNTSFLCLDECCPRHYDLDGVCYSCHEACGECEGPGPMSCRFCVAPLYEPEDSDESSNGGSDNLVTCVKVVPTTATSSTAATAINNNIAIIVGSSASVLAVIIIGVIVIIILALIVLPYFKYKMRMKRGDLRDREERIQNDYNYSLELRRLTVQSSFRHNIPKSLIVPSCNLILGKSVGQGEFGIVYKGHLKTTMSETPSDAVAVKTLKGFVHKDSVTDLLRECAKMSKFEHPNVLKLSGVCLDGGPAPYIIMPFMANGSLLSYLREERESLVLESNSSEENLLATRKKLLDMCLQVGKGMEYLASKRVVHRDLAARNCMIDMNFIIKVADFGLAESIDSCKLYFRQDRDDIVKLPMKWLAPECINEGIFSEKSDVWSYGITCWEIFSGGKIPYRGVHTTDLPRKLDAGYRMEQPLNLACSDDVYSTMLSCWEYRIEKRPFFSELVEGISTQLVVMAEYTPLFSTEN